MTERYERLIELVFRNDPDVSAYIVGAANTVDAAFAGTTTMFTVSKGATYRSKTIRRKGWGRTQYHNRGLTRVHYDPEDFWTSGSTLPHDKHQSYIRVAEISAGGTTRPEGPIFVIPPPGWATNPRPTLTIAGTAPAVAASPILVPPPGAMHVVVPRFTDFVRVRNLDGANDLFVSFSEGMPEVLIPAGESQIFYDGADSEIYLRGGGGAIAFDATFALVNGEMA
jgi:hypothetical protein